MLKNIILEIIADKKAGVMLSLFFLNFFRMSKRNWLRATINRTALNNKHIRIIYDKNFIFFDSWYFRGYNRVYKTWKHNRKTQFK